MHLAVIAGLAVLASCLVPRCRHALVMATLTVYVGIVGDVASLTRAYVMALALALAHALARPVRPVDALGRTLLVVLLASPAALLSVGLQLSFAATLAVVAVVSRGAFPRPPRDPALRWPRRVWRRVAGNVMAAVALSVAVEVFIAPLQLYHFGRASAVGPLATPAFLLPVAVVQVLSIAATALAGIPGVGPASMAALGAVSKVTAAALLGAARLAPPAVAHPAPDFVAYYGGILLVWATRGRRAAWPVGAGLVVLSFVLR
jgi:competence protein ComEC